MSDTSTTTPTAAAVPVPVAVIQTVSHDIDVLSADESVQKLEASLLARIPKNVRGGIYEAGKAAGIIAGAGFSVAALLEGNAKLYALAAAGLLLSFSAWISKANLA